MEEILFKIERLSAQVEKMQKQIEEYENVRTFENWIPRKKIKEFLDYGDTQMAALLNGGELIVSEIGIRKFIKKESLIRFLEKNVKK